MATYRPPVRFEAYDEVEAPPVLEPLPCVRTRHITAPRSYRPWRKVRRNSLIPSTWVWWCLGGLIGILLGYIISYAILDKDPLKLSPRSFKSQVQHWIKDL